MTLQQSMERQKLWYALQHAAKVEYDRIILSNRSKYGERPAEEKRRLLAASQTKKGDN